MTNNSKQVLGIIGSPRKKGNTDILVKTILESASEANAKVDAVYLNELKINPCQACNYCAKNGSCRQDDDMKSIIDKMKKSDIWIFGTPVYWWGPTAQFKLFIDRWFDLYHNYRFNNKKVLLVIPSGGGTSYAKYTEAMLKDALVYMGATVFGTLFAPNTSGRGEVKNDLKLMGEAKRLGKEILK
ncbi:MAG TPA: flavodoxin family protein [Candidatus Bathyarchaeia archaeon]|nr:flavodoxin family protein [Candidatus Bathyarchaeia archaeon]